MTLLIFGAVVPGGLFESCGFLPGGRPGLRFEVGAESVWSGELGGSRIGPNRIVAGTLSPDPSVITAMSVARVVSLGDSLVLGDTL